MYKLTLISIDGSTGVVLPGEVLVRLKASAGDIICLIDEPDGYLLTAFESEHEAQLRAARRIMQKRRAALRRLA
jgi:putative addiction module antidote